MAKPKSTMPIVTEITQWTRHTHRFLDEALMTTAHDLGRVGMEGILAEPIYKEGNFPLISNFHLRVTVELYHDEPSKDPCADQQGTIRTGPEMGSTQ